MDQINQPNKKIQQQQNQKSIMTIYGHRCPNMVIMGVLLWSGCPIMVMPTEKADTIWLWPDWLCICHVLKKKNSVHIKHDY